MSGGRNMSRRGDVSRGSGRGDISRRSLRMAKDFNGSKSGTSQRESDKERLHDLKKVLEGHKKAVVRNELWVMSKESVQRKRLQLASS